jgi:hypothetical protein
MLSNTGKPMLIFSTTHLVGLAYPSAFIPFDIHHRLRIADTWYIHSNIFRVYMFLSPFAIDWLEPAVQESVNKAYQYPSA